MGFEQLHRFIHLLGGFGVDGQPQIHKGKTKCVLGVVDHQDIIHIGFTPQGAPAGNDRLIFDQSGIVDKPQHSPCIRNGIFIGGVVGLVEIKLIDVFEVGDIGHIHLLQHALCNHARDHIVRWNNNIIDRTAGFQLGIHGFIGIIVGVDHLDAGDLLKRLINVQ